MAVAGAFLMSVPPSWPKTGVLLVGWRAAERGEHAADLVRRRREGAVAIGEVGAGDGEPGQGEHAEGDVPVPGLVEADLVVVEADLVLADLEALLHAPSGSRELLARRHWAVGAVALIIGS
jgi:hypothetical protein